MTRDHQSILQILTVLAVAAVCLVFAMAARADTHLGEPCADPVAEREGDTVCLFVGDIAFRIPALLFDIVPGQNSQNRAVRLLMRWPDLTWNSRGELLENFVTPGRNGRISVLVRYNPQSDGAFERMFFGATHYRPGLEQSHEFVDEHYNLHRYLWIGEPRSLRADEVYVWPSESDILIYIQCTNERAPEVSYIVYPSCRHNFYHYGLHFYITYDRHLLPEWQQIQSNIKTVFDQYHEAAINRDENANTGDGSVPVNDLISFDQQLRAWIDSVRVPDFDWGDGSHRTAGDVR